MLCMLLLSLALGQIGLGAVVQGRQKSGLRLSSNNTKIDWIFEKAVKLKQTFSYQLGYGKEVRTGKIVVQPGSKFLTLYIPPGATSIKLSGAGKTVQWPSKKPSK